MSFTLSKRNALQDSFPIVHGQGQMSSRKLLKGLEIRSGAFGRLGSLCPWQRGAGQVVPRSMRGLLRFIALVTARGLAVARLELRKLAHLLGAGAEKFNDLRFRRGAVDDCDCALHLAAHRPDAASVLNWVGAPARSNRGMAAMSCRVYSCCGAEKICSVPPHSTISP